MVPLVLLAGLGLVAAYNYAPLSCADQVSISNLFLEVLESNNYGKDLTPGDTAAKWTRLAFHDCGTWDPSSGTGGCHASIANNCPNGRCERYLDLNKGLAAVSDDLENLWYPWRNTISRTDFWSLAAKVALEWSSGGTLKLRWGYGRTDDTGYSYWPDRHPDAKDGFYAIKNHMVDRLGFTWEEAIALLGSHSLGETHFENSGYRGRWVPVPANYLNNGFYKVLLKYNWYPTNVGNGSYAGAGKREFVTDQLRGSVLLASDAATQYDIGDFTCTLSNGNKNSKLYNYRCPYENSLQPIVKRFANDNNYWLSVFAYAFETLSEFGCDNISYNPDSDVEYDLYQTNWRGYNGWYSNSRDYGVNYRSGSGSGSYSGSYSSGSGSY